MRNSDHPDNPLPSAKAKERSEDLRYQNHGAADCAETKIHYRRSDPVSVPVLAGGKEHSAGKADFVEVSDVHWVVAAASQEDRDRELFGKAAVLPAHRTSDPIQKVGHGIGDPAHGCGDKSRPAGVYSDYTYPSPDNISLKSLLPQEGGGKSCHFGGLHGVFQLLQPLTA